MTRAAWLLALAAAAYLGEATAQPGGGPRNDLPQPYRTTRDWGELPAGVKWAAVTAVEASPDGNIYVVHRCFANSCAGRSEAPILKYDANGKLLKSWGAGMFIFPHGGTVDRDGNLWLTDARGEKGIGHQVFKFSPDGKVLMTLGKAGVSGSGPDLFDQPTDVVVAPGGEIFVTDSHRNGKNNRVVKFTKDGTFIKEWGRKGSGPGEISEPHTIAMDSRGRLFVGDRENNRIQIFDQEGKYLAEWRQFGRPSGIYITRDDTIYVADSESGPDTGAHELPGIRKGIRVGSARDGTVTAFIEDMESTAPDHSGAEGVGVDASGNVYGAVVRRQMLERHVLGAQGRTESLPRFELDPSWPKPLPNNWILGGAASVAVDARDHVWVLHRPASAPAAELAAGKKVAPPVVEFDPQGNVVQAWGGPGSGYDWPEENRSDYPRGSPAEHGIFVDHQDRIWIAGNGDVVLGFTREGQFLRQIGRKSASAGSNDTRLLGNPTDAAVAPATNELFISDGYLNRRVIVFDATTGQYKRHWGAYGNRPDDGPAVNYEAGQSLPRQFFAVHCIRLSNDGLVYVCDRQRNRVQVFQQDGTFVSEVVVAKDTPAGAGITVRGPASSGAAKGGFGSVYRVGFSSDKAQEYLYVGDASNSKVWILRRANLQLLGSFDARGVHHLAGADSKGNIYISGTRLPQKLALKVEPADNLR